MENENSYQITIFRAGSFLSRAQDKDVDAMFSESKAGIGSYFENINSTKIGSGMSFEEEDLLMPFVIDTPKEDRDYRKKVNEYYQDIETNIPFGEGLKLEIGLRLGNDVRLGAKVSGEINLPINPPDYIKYRHALKHPQVALTKEEAESNMTKRFYVMDPKNIQRKTSRSNKEKDDAMKLYLSLKEDSNKVDMMLTLLGVEVRSFTGKDAEVLKVEELRSKAESNPQVFVEMYNAENMEIRAMIKSMVNTEVLKVVGTRYLDAETKQLIGNNLEETIYFFQDETENSDKIMVLKALHQEAKKKPAKEPGKRKTQVPIK